MPRPDIHDVAAAAGVSIGTVSNVMNRPEVVAERTRERVRRTIAELGYVRNESARQLRAGTSRTVAVVVLDVANPFFTDVTRGVEAVTDARDSVVTVCSSGHDPDREDRYLEALLEQRVRGLLITPADARNPRLDRFTDTDIPVVFVDADPGSREVCSVRVDNATGGRLAAEHVLALDHSRVAFLGGPLDTPQVADRLAGVTETVARQQHATLEVLMTEGMRIEDGIGATEELLAGDTHRRPTAVICANDLLALGLLQDVMRRGLRVPDDLAIVGYDDIVYAGAAPVPLTSVRQPSLDLGRAAAELLFAELDEGSQHTHRSTVFTPALIVRASTDPARA